MKNLSIYLLFFICVSCNNAPTQTPQSNTPDYYGDYTITWQQPGYLGSIVLTLSINPSNDTTVGAITGYTEWVNKNSFETLLTPSKVIGVLDVDSLALRPMPHATQAHKIVFSGRLLPDSTSDLSYPQFSITLDTVDKTVFGSLYMSQFTLEGTHK